MSERSGLGNKGEKNQSKFKGIDINNIYKGTSATQQKFATVRNQQHGLQSLGKVASIRRMPPPANLPSLKSEAGGNDPFINLVPSNSAGWKEEKSVESGGVPPKSSQPLPVTGPSQEQNARRQTPTDGGHQPVQALGGSNMGPPLWSSITSGVGKQDGFLDQNSPHFQEEFPQLAAGSDERTQTSKKAEESRELPYGPGPSLRPQNMATWREGGCAGTAQPQSPSSFPSPQPSFGPASSADSCAPHEDAKPQPPTHLMMPAGPMRPPMVGMHPPPPHPSPHMGQVPMMSHPYRTLMMPPFAFRHGFPSHFPQNFMHPGMPRPPFMNADFRFRGMPPQMVPPSMRHDMGDEPKHDRPPVVKDRDLEQFDQLALSDGAWARPSVDVDYTERLVFSDEDDGGGTNTRSDRGRLMRSTSEGERDRKKSSETDREDRLVSSKDRSDKQLQSGEMGSGVSPGSNPPKETWMSQPVGPYIRSPQPMDQRAWPSGGMPLGKTGTDVMGYHPMAPFGPRPGFHPPKLGGGQRGGVDGDDDEVWKQRRKQQSEDMAAAIERARQRRLEEERRMKEEQMAAAKEKLRQLDEKLAKKEEKTRRDSAGENSEGREGSSAQENGDRGYQADGRSSNTSVASSCKTSTRLPPRFQKSPSYHSGDEPSYQTEREVDVPAESDLTSSCSSLDQSHQVQRSSPPGHGSGHGPGGQKQPGSPRGCPPSQHPMHGVPRMPGMGYWQYDPRWGPFMMDPRMGHRPQPFDPATGGEDVRMRGPGLIPPYYGYQMDVDPRNYMNRFDQRDRNQMMLSGAGAFREESEPRDADDVLSSDGDLVPFGQRGYLRCVSEANSSKDCDEETKRHGSFSSRNSDRGFSLKSSRDPPSADHRGAPPQVESTRSVVQAKESLSKQDSELNDPKNFGADDPDDLKKGGTDDGRKSKRDKQIRNSERKESQKTEKLFEHSYRHKNNPRRYHDKDSRDDHHSSGSPSSDLHPSEHHSSCPPPIPAQLVQQNSLVNSSYTPLKRTHSTLSTSSANSSERKTDSPGGVARSNMTVGSQKSLSRESLKSGAVLEVRREVKEAGAVSRGEKGNTEKVDQIALKSAANKGDSKGGAAQQDTPAPGASEKTESAKAEMSGDKPANKKLKDGSKRSYPRRRQDHHDSERSGRTGQASREFVRGGRGKAYGYGRWYGGGGSRERGGAGYNQNYEGQYDVEQERYEPGRRPDINPKRQVVDGTFGTGVGGEKQPDVDGRWQSGQNRSALKNGGSRNKERPRGQRSNWHVNERLVQDNSLGSEKSGGNRQKPAKQADGKEAGVATSSTSTPGDAGAEKDAVKQEQNLTSAPLKHLDSMPKKEASQQDEGQGSNRNQPRKGGGGGNSGGGGRVGGSGGYPDLPRSGQGRQGPKQEGQQPRRSNEGNRMGNNNRAKEDVRYDQNGPTPPRFANNEGRPSGPYGYGDRRRRGGGGQGPGRTNHQGNRGYKDQPSKKTPAPEHNEEWETASEGSDNLSCGGVHAKKDANREAASAGEKPETKKSFSSQRRGTRRCSNHGDPPSCASGRPQDISAGSIKEDGNLQKGSDVAAASTSGQENVAKSNSDKPNGSNGTVHPVYRLDQVIYNDPQSIQRAVSSANRRYNWKFMGKMMCENEKLNDFYQDTMSDITSFWRSDEKEYNGNHFNRNNMIFSGSQFRRNKSHGVKQPPLPPRFARLHGIKKQQQLDDDWPRGDSEDWFPQSLRHPPVSASALSLAVDVHMYGGERHDSGVDMSEPPNSLVSSCRSSPCNGEDIFHCSLNQSSYLDFAFDDDFNCAAESTRVEDDIVSFDGGSGAGDDLHYMSRAADSLGMKITSVRNVWNSEISQDLGKDQQFASDKMRFAMLSDSLPGQSAGDWKYEQKDAIGTIVGCQPQSSSASSSASTAIPGKKLSSNLELLDDKKALLLPRVLSEDSLSARECYSNRLFSSSYLDYTSLNLEVWKKNPAGLTDGPEKSGFVLPPKFGPLISDLSRPETTDVVPVTGRPGVSVRSGVIGSHRGQQRNVADHNRGVLSSPVLGQHHGAGAASASQGGTSCVVDLNESDQLHAVASDNPAAMNYLPRLSEDVSQDVNCDQRSDKTTTATNLGKKKGGASGNGESKAN